MAVISSAALARVLPAADMADMATLIKASVALGKRGAVVAAQRAVVASVLATLAHGADETSIKAFKAVIRLNYMVGYTSDTSTRIKAWLDSDATKRIEDRATASIYQLAYAAASTELTRIVEAAGLAKQLRGAATPEARAKAAAIKAAGEGSAEIVNAPVASSDGFIAPQSLDDVVAQLDDVRRDVARLQKAASAAKLLDGDNGATVRDAIAAILDAIKAAHGPAKAKAPRAAKAA